MDDKIVEAIARGISETAGIDWQDLPLEAQNALTALRKAGYEVVNKDTLKGKGR